MKNMTRGNDGVVSLLTTIMISLLLIIITTSLVTLEVLQLRKAADSEQSLRAYYIAEAGVEDAVSKILQNPTNRVDQPCQSNAGYDTAGAASWTCQRISYSGAPVGELTTPDASKTVDPGHINGAYQSVIIEWNKSNSAGPYSMPTALPSESQYLNLGYAAPPMEVTIVKYPTGGFSASEVGTRVKIGNALIVPRGTGVGATVNSEALPGAGQWDANCAPLGRAYAPGGTQGLGGFNCYAVITNLDPGNTFDYMFRLRSRYAGTTYRLTFKAGPNGTGATVRVPDGTATIDVTAKAGASHRRVMTKLPLNSGAAAGLDYVIYSDSDICKDFNIIDNAFPATPGC